MITGRHFKTPFSMDLNECNENDFDGVFYTIIRFEQFIITLKKKIDSDNQEILDKLKNEEDINSLNISPFELTNCLDYFSDNLLKSFIVSIYSYFEHKLEQISEISQHHLSTAKKIKDYKRNSDGKGASDIEKFNSYLKFEIIPDLHQHDLIFQEILKWKDLRKRIVHNNSFVDKNSVGIDSFSSIKIENDYIKITDEHDLLQFLKLIDKYLNAIFALINTKYDLIEYLKPK